MSVQYGGTSRLTYSMATVPAPLATDRPAHIDIVVSNSGTEAVWCKQILVVLPAGDLAQDLVPAEHSITPTVQPSGQWTVGKIEGGVFLALPKDEMAAFTAGGTPLTVRPTKGESVSLTTDGLLLRLKVLQTNTLAGTALLRVRETVSVDNETWETNEVVLPLAKYPSAEALTADVVGNLALHEAGTNGNPSSTPATLLKPGQEAVLSWTAPSDAVCDVYYDGGKHAATLSKQSTWEHRVTGLTRDTHFHVQVELDRSGGKITHHLSTAVAVEEPTFPQLTVTKITAGGRRGKYEQPLLTIDGAVRVEKDSHFSGMVEVEKESHFYGTVYGGEGTLTVGDAILAKRSLTAEADVTVKGKLTAQNDVETKKLAVTEKALVGSTNFSGMADGDLWIRGKFSADRAELNTLLGTPEKLTGAFDGTERTASSHGLLLLWARTLGSHATRTIYVSIDNGNGWEVVGAATIDYGNAPDLKGSSATVPLRKGQKYMIWQEGSGGGTTDAYFFPVLSG
ncbi:hypothetical protein ACFY1P_03945 [Streptomyces sp. NPDC001407]|uniref:hypothetical protein n=1 Tax=unclassified Streptomyces TaxID=2593676 RepID=UPI0033D292EB